MGDIKLFSAIGAELVTCAGLYAALQANGLIVVHFSTAILTVHFDRPFFFRLSTLYTIMVSYGDKFVNDILQTERYFQFGLLQEFLVFFKRYGVIARNEVVVILPVPSSHSIMKK